ncbi:hypothetical protein [Aurantimonas coralicida]|uniref:hypothetical protein n=1 Tax=Aurantimonas coralicida TaxID=182270 RepID=UPI001E52FB3F|nr:hypothetical protein [Aurantimonas coralicida]MCD1645218.1 hypothetical protein [Aurantimonas coralicida]
MTLWQDIESAPKDGTIIDLWHPAYGRMTDCWWDDGEWAAFVSDGFTHWSRPTKPDGTPCIIMCEDEPA